MIETRTLAQTAMITLTRPEKRNALNIQLCQELSEAIDNATSQGARALVVTGTGTSFCSGADLDDVYSPAFRDALYTMLNAVTTAPVPVIAAVNGPAVGAGTQLAIAADLRVVAPGARFALPTARIGLAVDQWTIRRLSLLAGHGAARRLLLACEELDANAAWACGLADRQGGPEDALAWAEGIAELAPLTVAYSKRVLNHIADADIDAPLTEAFEACWTSSDLREGRLARAEHRPPRFQGR